MPFEIRHPQQLTLRDAVAELYSPENIQAQQQRDIDATSQFGRGWAAAGLGGQANALWTQVAKAGKQGREADRQALELQARDLDQQTAQWAPRVQNVTDVRSLRDLGDWAGGAAGNLRTSVAPALGGLVGAGVGALAAPLTGGVINPVTAGFIGSSLAGYDMEADEAIAQAMRDTGIRANKSYDDILNAGRVKGGITSILEAAVPAVMGGKLLTGQGAKALGRMALNKGATEAERAAERAAQQALVKGGVGAAAKHVGKKALESSVGEFATEGTQSLTGAATQNYLQDRGVLDFSAEDYKQALNEGAAGAVAGGGMGVIGGLGEVGHAYTGSGATKAKDVAKDPARAAADLAADAGDIVGKYGAKGLGFLERMTSEPHRAFDTLISSDLPPGSVDGLAMQWAQHVMGDKGSSAQDVADAKEFVLGAANGDATASEHYRNKLTVAHHVAKSAESDLTVAADFSGQSKSSLMQAEPGHKMPNRPSTIMDIEAALLTPDKTPQNLGTTADIWRKQGVAQGLLDATSGEGDTAQRQMSIALLGWVARGFKSVDGDVFVPESLTMRFKDKTPKMIQGAAKLAFEQGLIGHDEARLVPQVIDLASRQYAEETAVRDTVLGALPDYARGKYAPHINELTEVLRHAAEHGTNKRQEEALLDVFGSKEAIAQAMSKFSEPKNKSNPLAKVDEIDDTLVDEDGNPVDGGQGYETGMSTHEGATTSSVRGHDRDNNPYDLRDERHKERLAERVGEAGSGETRRAIGVWDRVIETAGGDRELQHEGETALFEAYGADYLPDAHKEHLAEYGVSIAEAINELQPQYRTAILSKINKRFQMVRTEAAKSSAAADAIAKDKVGSFSERDVDARGPGATIDKGILFLERDGVKTPFMTSAMRLLKHAWATKKVESDTTNKGVGLHGIYQDLLATVAALMEADTRFNGRIGYKTEAGGEIKWLARGDKLPDDFKLPKGTVAAAQAQARESLVAGDNDMQVVRFATTSREMYKALRELAEDRSTSPRWRRFLMLSLKQRPKEKRADFEKRITALYRSYRGDDSYIEDVVTNPVVSDTPRGSVTDSQEASNARSTGDDLRYQQALIAQARKNSNPLPSNVDKPLAPKARQPKSSKEEPDLVPSEITTDESVQGTTRAEDPKVKDRDATIHRDARGVARGAEDASAAVGGNAPKRVEKKPVAESDRISFLARLNMLPHTAAGAARKGEQTLRGAGGAPKSIEKKPVVESGRVDAGRGNVEENTTLEELRAYLKLAQGKNAGLAGVLRNEAARLEKGGKPNGNTKGVLVVAKKQFGALEKQTTQTKEVETKPGTETTLGELPMHYTMPNKGIRADLRTSYPKGATTAELMKDGHRTATTRRAFGKVGDTFTVKGGTYRITAVEKIDLRTAEGKELWSKREGWDVEYAMNTYPSQVRDGVVQTIFEKVGANGVGSTEAKLPDSQLDDAIYNEDIDGLNTVDKLMQYARHVARRYADLDAKESREETLTEREEGLSSLSGQLVFEARKYLKNPNSFSGTDFASYFDDVEHTDADVDAFVKAIAGVKQSRMTAGAASEARTMFAPQWHEGFAKALDALRQAFEKGGQAAREATKALLPVGRTPVVLRAVIDGSGKKPFKRSDYMVGNGGTLYLKGLNQHGVSKHADIVGYGVLRNLPALLADPIAVFASSESSEDSGSYKVLVDARSDNGLPVVVALKPEKAIQGARGELANFVATVYPVPWLQVRSWNNNGALRYYNEKNPLASKPGSNPQGTVDVETSNTREGFDASVGAPKAAVKVMTAGELEALPPAAWSKQTADLGTGKRATEEKVAAAKQHILDTLGTSVEALFVKYFGDNSSGSWTPGELINTIRLALNGDVLGAAYHESMHEFLSQLRKAGGSATQAVLERVAKNPILNRKIELLLAEHPEAAAQVRNDPEEAVAFMYQFWRAGLLKLGPETQTFFEKVKAFFAKVLGKVSAEVRDAQHAEAIMRAFSAGVLKEDATRDLMLRKLNESSEAHEAALAKVDKTGLGIINAFGKFMFSAEAMMKATKNIDLISLASDFNQEAGTAKGEQQDLFDATRQQMNIWMNRLDNILTSYSAEDLELARHALSTGVPAKDRVAQEIVERINTFNEKMFEYLHTRDVRRMNENHQWVPVEHRKNYFTRVWNTEAVRDNTEKLRDMLLKHHLKELQNIAKQANGEVLRNTTVDPLYASAVELGKNKGERQSITPEMIADAIVVRLLNSGGQVELDENTSSLGMTPVATSVNRRSLSWIDSKVFDEFMSKDITGIMTSYVASMVKRAEHTKVFGHGAERLKTKVDRAVLREMGGASLIANAEGRLGDAIRAWKKEREIALNRGEEFTEPYPTLRSVGQRSHFYAVGEDQGLLDLKKALKDLEQGFKAVMAMEGTLGADCSPALRKANSLMMTYQTVRLLPLVLFSSVNDIMGIVANDGGELKDAWAALTAGVKEIKLRWQDKKSQGREAQRAEMWGSVDAGTFMDSLGQMYGSSYFTGKAKRFSDSFFKWNGMEGWNRAMRITATSAAERAIKAYQAGGVDKTDKAAVARSEALFGKDFDHSTIALDANGDLDTNDSVNQAAVMRWVNNAIMSPNAAHRPIWASDTRMAAVWMLKQFAYTFHRVMLKNAVAQAKLGNYRPAMVLVMGYAPVTIAADAVKEMLVPGDDPPWMKMGLGAYLRHGVDRSGILGVPGMIFDSGSSYGVDLLGPSISQVAHIPFDPASRSAVGVLPFGGRLQRLVPEEG